MAVYTDEAAILKSRDVGEFDRIFVLFGRKKGKFGVIAKSVRKLTSRKRGHLQTFSLCKIACAEGKRLDIIVEAESIFDLDTDNFDSDTYERVGFAGMVLDKLLPDGVPEPEIYKLWRDYIVGDLSEQSTKVFILQVLIVLGFMSESRAQKIRISEKWDIASLRLYVQKILDTL